LANATTTTYPEVLPRNPGAGARKQPQTRILHYLTTINATSAQCRGKLHAINQTEDGDMTDMHDARREVALSLREIAACYLKFAQRGRQFDGLGGASATGGKIGKGSCRSRGSIQSAPVNRAQAAYEGVADQLGGGRQLVFKF
jgi:hypothetical protein